MSPYRRNLLVGLTVLTAMVILGWMILKFGDRPARFFAVETMPMFLISERADGLGEGSNITYRGVIVGRVKIVKRSDSGNDITITAEVDKKPPLPANLEGEIVMLSALGGTSTIALQDKGPKPTGVLEAGATLKAHFVGLQFLPPEFAELARELRLAAVQFRESQVIIHIDEQVQKAGKVLDSANELVADPKLKEDLKIAVANIRQASETVNKIGGKLDKLSDDASTTIADVRKNVNGLSDKFGERLTQVATTLDHFNSIAAKIDSGQGTAGQLVNDPKLYQALVDSARELNGTITDLKRLVEQWEQEGISFKLK